jgi:carbon-monoxide dehydrogenase medium subunit
MKPAAFEYHAPATVAEAVDWLHELGDDAKVIAGGQSLVPMLALRLAVFDHLVDVHRIAELRGVTQENGHLTVGAATPDVVIERDRSVAEAVPLLALATPFIGHFQIRNRGTVGGSLAHADPAAEYPAVALALDAELEATSVRGVRSIAAREFFEGMWTTALAPDELLTAVRFPVWPGRSGFAVEEFARRHGDFAIAGAVVGVQLADDGSVARAAIALLGMGSTPLRAASAEAALAGAAPGSIEAKEVGRMAMADVEEPPGDLHASGPYRLRVGQAMVARAWARAVEGAQRG